MSNKPTGAKELIVQVSEFPDAGIDLCGELPFAELDIQPDEVTELPYPMSFRLHLAQVGEDLLVSGHLEAVVSLMCDRCAEFSDHKLSTDDVCHRYENVAGQVVDLTDDVREDILIAFPQSHLCSETCRGLCPKCGQNLNEGDCDCETDTADDESEAAEAETNPWSALDQLKL